MPYVSDALKEMFKKFDGIMEQHAREMKTTCVKGCNNCCMLFATCTLPEGILIAEVLLQKPDWRAIVPRLKKAAEEFCFEGVGAHTYLNKKIPCVFLQDGLCSIYEIRPSTCRYYYSIQDPKLCDPDDPRRKVATIDSSQIMDRINMFSIMVANKLHTPDIIAPIPLMVLYCMFMLVKHGMARKDDEEALRTLKKAMRGIPLPADYIEKYPTVMVDESESVRLSPEEFEELRKRHENPP
jgi:Fe-S-cluster containining protein